MGRALALLSLIALCGCTSEGKTNNRPVECGNLDRVLDAFEVYIERNELEKAEGEEGACFETCTTLVSCLQDEVCAGDRRMDSLGDFSCSLLCSCRGGAELAIPQCAQLTAASAYEHTPICDIAVEEPAEPEPGPASDAEVSEGPSLCCQLYCCMEQTCPAENPGVNCGPVCERDICEGDCPECDFNGCVCG